MLSVDLVLNDVGDPVQETGQYWKDEFYLESEVLLDRILDIAVKRELLNGLERATIKAEMKNEKEETDL